jgi:hypothetical protein
MKNLTGWSRLAGAAVSPLAKRVAKKREVSDRTFFLPCAILFQCVEALNLCRKIYKN